jgi:hypothetical protein
MTRIVRETGDDGIRSYGPGKFHTLVDSYAFEVAQDGVDEEASYGESDGWYGLLWVDKPGTRNAIRKVARDAGGELTDEENELLDDTQGIIFFERSDGIVEADWHAEQKEAEKSWATIEADTAEEEEDEEEEDDEDEADDEEEEEEDDDFDLDGEMEEGLVIKDARGSKYSVSLSGKNLGTFSDFDDALLAGVQAMHAQNLFPHIFHVNDHGNVDLLAVTPEVKRGKVVSVEYTVERSWV